MSAPVAALIVRPDGTAEIRDVDPDLAALQGLVGGYLEAVATGPGWHAYGDEDGRAKGSGPTPTADYNLAAPHLIRTILDRPSAWRELFGTIVFLGDGPEGEEADVPPEVVGAAVRLWGLDPDPA